MTTIVFFIAYQGLENWLIYPKMTGRAVQISSLAAIAAAVQLVIREVVYPRQDAH